MEFNPIKTEIGGKKARSVVWDTETLKIAISGLEKGKKLVANPFYENNTKLLKSDIVFKRTAEENEEFIKCMNDIVYFANNYCKLMTPEGRKKIELRDYQIDYLRHLEQNRLSIFLSCRQSGKTTTSAIFLLHYILFNIDKNALVLGNKLKTAKEILNKIQNIFYEVPFFLKPGVSKWNVTDMALDNGCMCMCEATTINSGISFTFHCVLSDEFAHIQPNIMDEFYNNLFPTITAGKARFMITSTQKGFNLFYRLYKGAEEGINEYKPFRVDWWQVPEWDPDTKKFVKRDEKWMNMQVANYGGLEAFNKQFGTSFDISGNTLIAPRQIKRLESSAIKYINIENLGIIDSQNFFFDPNYDINNLKNSICIITIDISEGIGQDYTVFNFNIVKKIDKEIIIENIGYYITNESKPEKSTLVLSNFFTKYCSINTSLISIEYNLYGELFIKYLFDYMNNNKININEFNESVIVKYQLNNIINTGDSNKKKKTFRKGIKISSATKKLGCNLFKQSIESKKYIIKWCKAITELENFSDVSGNGTFEASWGHDDITMSGIQIMLLKETLQYNTLVCTYSNYIDENGIINNFTGNLPNIYSLLK